MDPRIRFTRLKYRNVEETGLPQIRASQGIFFSRTGKGRKILYLVGEIHNSCLKSGKSQAKVFILIAVLNVTSHFTKIIIC